ncbi:MAG: HAD family phosphatase [Bdellovibrionota bacterium]
MSPIDTVVFDLGGVLVDWNPRYLFRKVFPDANEMELFLTTVTTQEWNEKQDAGRPWSVALEELIRLHPNYETEIRTYHRRWPEMMAGAIPGTGEIIREIKTLGRHGLFALSNWSSETFEHAKARFPELKLFDSIVLSGDEKMIKPDPRFFRLLESRHRVVPSRTIFIDDVEKNIIAARALGYHTHHFKSAESLRSDLAAREILPR